MQHVDVLVIGGGQAGLAMSRCLSELGIEHLVLERGRVGERWRSERWDSLQLLTPRWMTRLPGLHADGGDPSGFMHAREVVELLERYASFVNAPLLDDTRVLRVEPAQDGYRVLTDRGCFAARCVVIATGACDTPLVPSFAAELPARIEHVLPTRYKSPAQLPEGGVLVVGASATGVQLAEEIHASGRPVTLAVGKHTRLPRTYRGHDILFWLEQIGALDEPSTALPNLEASRRQPSMQLVGRDDHRTLDLAVLAARGVRLTGRVLGAHGERVMLARDLAASTAAADAKLARLLQRIDAHLALQGARELPAIPAPPQVPCADEPAELDLARAGIRSVLWATGFRRRYPWLHVPVLDARGELQQRGGITPARGLYALGLPLMRTRKSSFLDGVGADARALAACIETDLSRQSSWAA